MKLLIVLILCVGIYSLNCKNTEFDDEDVCIDCKYSFCKTCDGTNKCTSCPDGFSGDDCLNCANPNEIIFEGQCSTCDKVSSAAGSMVNDGISCTADAANQCKGLSFFETNNGVNICTPCSILVKGCRTCSQWGLPGEPPVCLTCFGNLEFKNGACVEPSTGKPDDTGDSNDSNDSNDIINKNSAATITYGLCLIIGLLILI